MKSIELGNTNGALILSCAMAITLNGQTSSGNPACPDNELTWDASYQSPYQFSDDLLGFDVPDFDEAPRKPEADAPPKVYWNASWTLTPEDEWNDFSFVKDNLNTAWGPWLKAFPAPAGYSGQTLDWYQKRIVAAGSKLRGKVPYAHHHLHFWDVPDQSPWTTEEIDSKCIWPGVGIDCSDFTHWMYSYGLGINLPTSVGAQAGITKAVVSMGGDYESITVERLFDTQNGYAKNFQELVNGLQTGDLLFINADPNSSQINHVILWLGDFASDSNQKDPYLVFDSHGDSVLDSNGTPIPTGPQIRPFRETSFYYNSYSHTLRFSFPVSSD